MLTAWSLNIHTLSVQVTSVQSRNLNERLLTNVVHHELHLLSGSCDYLELQSQKKQM